MCNQSLLYPLILRHFLPFYHSKNQKSKFWKNEKKVPRAIIILHMFTINDYHMIYGSYIEYLRQNIYHSFWFSFCFLFFLLFFFFFFELLKEYIWVKVNFLHSMNRIYKSDTPIDINELNSKQQLQFWGFILW